MKKEIKMKTIYIAVSILLVLTACSKNSDSDVIEVKKLKEESESLVSRHTSDDDDKTDSDQIEQETEPVSGDKSVITPKEARGYLGKELTVEGYVADVFRNDKVAYLNFDKKYPNNTFSGVIFASNFEEFDDIYSYKNKTVKLKGTVSEYKGKPQIIIESESQLEIVK